MRATVPGSVSPESFVLRQGLGWLLAMTWIAMPIQRDGPLNLPWIQVKFAWALVIYTLIVVGVSRRHPDYPRSVVEPFAMALGLALGIGLLRPGFPHDGALFLGTASLLFFSLLRLDSKDVVVLATRAIPAIGALACGVAILQFVLIATAQFDTPLAAVLAPRDRIYFGDMGQTIGAQGVRLTSFFFHSNQLGNFLAVVFPFLLCGLWTARGARQKWMRATLLGALLISLLLSQSRTGLAVVLFEALVILVVAKPSKRWGLALLVGALALIVAVAIVSPNSGALWQRLQSLQLSGRDVVWGRALELIAEYPILGVGIGDSGRHLLERFGTTELDSMMTSYYSLVPYSPNENHPHNWFLALFLEGGVFFALGTLCFVAAVVWRGSRILVQSAKQGTSDWMTVAAAVSCLGQLLRSPFESYCFLASPDSGALVAISFALILKTGTPREGSPSR